jgi:hypothetical protein
MATEKQIRANRLNGLKGGVKTEAGKARVRMNAVTHGFFSQEILMKGEDHHLMARFREQLTAELKPEGELETLLVELIITISWRLKRMLNFEKRNGNKRVDYYTELAQERNLKYATSLDRQIYKAIHELQDLQRERLETQPPDTENNNFAETNPISQAEIGSSSSQQSVAGVQCGSGMSVISGKYSQGTLGNINHEP